MEVAELFTPYGHVPIEESILQKIWQKQDFLQSGLKTTSGQCIKILKPGKWNKEEGPDFKDAVIECNGNTLYGDIEIHIYPEDWERHNHSNDKRYDSVIAHISLFSSKQHFQNPIKQHITLLPFLTRSLDDYSLEYSVPDTSDLELFIESALQKNPLQTLENYAKARWEQKVAFALQRLDIMGDWNELCHQLVMEALGYRKNRVPMSELSIEFPYSYFKSNKPSSLDLYEKKEWNLSNIRPANQPKQRLQQYCCIMEQSIDWPQGIQEMLSLIGKTQAGLKTRSFRKQYKLTNLRNQLIESIFANSITGTRLDTIFCDAILPAYSALTSTNCYSLWFHWFLGDIPKEIIQISKKLDCITSLNIPHCNGLAQALLQLKLEFINESPKLSI